MRLLLNVAICLSIFMITSCSIVYDVETICETDVEFLNNDIAKYQEVREYNNSSGGYYYFDEIKLKALENNKCKYYANNANNRDDPTGATWGNSIISNASWFIPVKELHKGQRGRIKVKYFHHKWGAGGHTKVYLIKVYEN